MLEKNPKNEVALTKTGEIYILKEDYTKATEIFLQVLKISSKNIVAYEKIAYCFSIKGDAQNAINYYNKAFEYKSKNPQTYIEYANLMIREKEYSKALNKLAELKALEPDNTDCLNTLFLVNYLLAKEGKSNYNKEKALKIAREIEEKNLKFLYEKEKEGLGK